MNSALFDRYFDETHVAFRDACRRFAKEAIAPNATAWEEAGEFPRELYAQAAEAGVLAPTWPEEFGGGGGDVFHGVVAGEELQILLPRCRVAGRTEQDQAHGPETDHRAKRAPHTDLHRLDPRAGPPVPL